MRLLAVSFAGLCFSAMLGAQIMTYPTPSSGSGGGNYDLLGAAAAAQAASAQNLTNIPTARTALGLGTAALQSSSSFSLLGGYLSNTFPVGTGGVTANTLVQFDLSAPPKAIAATGGYSGIAASTVASGGNVEIVRAGVVGCIFENAAVIGDIAIPGTTTLNRCRDAGVTSSTQVPDTTPVIGLIQSAGAAGTSQSVRLHGPGTFGTLCVTCANTSAANTWSATQSFGTLTSTNATIGAGVSGAVLTIGDTTGTYTPYINFNNSNSYIGYAGINLVLQGGTGKGIRFTTNQGTYNTGNAWQMDSSGNFTPGPNNTNSIGSSTNTVKQIYVGGFVQAGSFYTPGVSITSATTTTASQGFLICNAGTITLPAAPGGGQAVEIVNTGTAACSISGNGYGIGNVASAIPTTLSLAPQASASLRFDAVSATQAWRILSVATSPQ
jgi:hypothetical protein